MNFSYSQILPRLQRLSQAKVLAALGTYLITASSSGVAFAAGILSPVSLKVTTGGGGGGISSDANTLGDIFCNVYNNLYSFANFYDAIAYTIGAYLIAHGIYVLAKHHEDRQFKISTGVLRITSGALLMALPSVAGALVTTVFVDSSGVGGLQACTATGATTSSTAVTLDLMLENAVANIQQPFLTVMSIMAILMGLFMIIHGLFHAAKHGYEPQQHSVSKIVINLFIGTLLISVGDSLDYIMGAVFGADTITSPVLNWAMVNNLTPDPAAQAHIQGAITAALTVVQMVGIIAFIRGLTIMKKAAEGSSQDHMTQGLTHLIGGVLAINIYQFLTVMQSTFGTNFF